MFYSASSACPTENDALFTEELKISNQNLISPSKSCISGCQRWRIQGKSYRAAADGELFAESFHRWRHNNAKRTLSTSTLVHNTPWVRVWKMGYWVRIAILVFPDCIPYLSEVCVNSGSSAILSRHSFEWAKLPSCRRGPFKRSVSWDCHRHPPVLPQRMLAGPLYKAHDRMHTGRYPAHG